MFVQGSQLNDVHDWWNKLWYEFIFAEIQT